MAKPTKFSPEAKEWAVRLVLEHQGEHGSQYGAIRSVAIKIGCKPGHAPGAARRAAVDVGQPPRLTTGERSRLTGSARENRKLERAIESSTQAAAFFAGRGSAAAGRDGRVHRPPDFSPDSSHSGPRRVAKA